MQRRMRDPLRIYKMLIKEEKHILTTCKKSKQVAS